MSFYNSAPRFHSTQKPVTEPQFNYLRDLCNRREVPSEIQELASTVKVGDFKGYDVSKAIDTAKACGWRRVKATAMIPENVENPTPIAQIAEKGYYEYEGAIYCVAPSKQNPTRTIAKVLRNEGHRGVWDFARGMIYRLKPEHRISLDRAKSFGHMYGFCMICGRTLTDPKSVEAGIGPVCAKRFM